MDEIQFGFLDAERLKKAPGYEAIAEIDNGKAMEYLKLFIDYIDSFNDAKEQILVEDKYHFITYKKRILISVWFHGFPAMLKKERGRLMEQGAFFRDLISYFCGDGFPDSEKPKVQTLLVFYWRAEDEDEQLCSKIAEQIRRMPNTKY